VSLHHVCEWNNTTHRWERISIDEAKKKYPMGLSSRSHVFMCELCGQVVTLTEESRKTVAYFRHSRGEANKTCPDRDEYQKGAFSFEASQGTLPLRLKLKEDGITFDTLEIGIPKAFVRESLQSIKILNKQGTVAKTYNAERLYDDVTTYLNVGDPFSVSYQVYFYETRIKLIDGYKFGISNPMVIEGLDPDGTIFDGQSGKKIPKDGNVKINHTYYFLLQNKKLPLRNGNNLEISLLGSCGQQEDWRVYKVKGKSYKPETIEFFAEYHARVSEDPVKLIPFWPQTVQDGYIFWHDADRLFFYVQGEYVKLKGYPAVTGDAARTFPLEKNEAFSTRNLVEFPVREKHQIVSIGRQSVLQYLYIWRKAFETPHIEKPKFQVKDKAGNLLEEYQTIPLSQSKALEISSEVDGYLEIRDTQQIVQNRIKVKADTPNYLTDLDIRNGYRLVFYQGLDPVWKAFIEASKQKHEENRNEAIDQNSGHDVKDTALYQKLCSCRGATLPVSLAMKRLCFQYRRDTRIYTWLRKQMLQGKMPLHAYRLLLKNLERMK
jgi:hypothetical protein